MGMISFNIGLFCTIVGMIQPYSVAICQIALGHLALMDGEEQMM